MPDPYKPSEFGGKIQENRVQPPPHIPNQAERLMLLYTTGDESGQSSPDNGETFEGMLPIELARDAALARGVSFAKGEAFEQLQAEADAAIAELAAQ
jgi:hypothetical protein